MVYIVHGIYSVWYIYWFEIYVIAILSCCEGLVNLVCIIIDSVVVGKGGVARGGRGTDILAIIPPIDYTILYSKMDIHVIGT